MFRGGIPPPFPSAFSSESHPGVFVSVCLCCPLQEAVCVCEEGYTEVLSPDGLLQQCAQIPVLEIPTAGSKNEDVKTSRAIDPTTSTTDEPGPTGRTWYLRPFGPGKAGVLNYFFFFFKQFKKQNKQKK